MSDQPIGSEGVARLHEQRGEHLFAAIHRLTGDQAVDVLCAYAGWDPRRLADELRAAGVTVEQEDERGTETIRTPSGDQGDDQ